ncbi:S9 family peptidase [Thermomonospora umbrina]|uniref:Dipeptidyl aminopeptidase/acylaminoacyl peptidase n=1 Tax=Thermomonospora umbrina TaxID=111806 RepID=A0A3D9SN81_9ACTN|nr:S9 family peptidase [Thermomonospora umbrina]REE97177.1 dipeptidyl aminopeptidase/acylaminoacyl peptidase [Thermomonospora umbrina]
MTLPPLIPRRLLFGPPSRLRPAPSRDGSMLAFLAAHDGAQTMWVSDGDGGNARPVTSGGVLDFAWAYDHRHLLYVRDQDGDENFHLHALDVVTGESRDLTPFGRVQARLLGVSPELPDTVLVGLNRDHPGLHDAYHLELRTGTLTLAARNEGFSQWAADRRLTPRAAVTFATDEGCAIVVRDGPNEPWRRLTTAGDGEDALTVRLVGFSADGADLYVLGSAGTETICLRRLDEKGASQIVYADPTYDVTGVGLHPRTGRPRLVTVQRERLRTEALDPEAAADLERIRRLSDGDVTLIGHDEADLTWLVQANVDDGPCEFLTFDRRTGTALPLFSHQPELADHELARMEPFTFTSRDGLTVHGYLTFPPGAGRERLPTVLAVHGGPYARDVWGFRGEQQWLANRGYLSVQVNFRGSTGYGKRFLEAGNREWGGRMQDDLVDALRWVIDRGHADPDRVGIYGSSYGGYAALAGAAFTPDLFRCAISMAGPANLRTFVESIPPSWAPMVARLHRSIGDPNVDADLLWERSPLSRAHDIRVPILIAHGANDPRVPRREAEQIVEALRKNGVDHEFLLFDDEGHQFGKPHNRLAFYAAAERFLATHLGGRHEPEPTSA